MDWMRARLRPRFSVLSGCVLQLHALCRRGGIFQQSAGFAHGLDFHTIAPEQLGTVESLIGMSVRIRGRGDRECMSLSPAGLELL